MIDVSDFSLTNKKSAARAFDFIDSIRDITAIDELNQAFAVEAGAFGFEHFVFARVNPGEDKALRNANLDKWPAEWYQRYVERGYPARDPVVREVASNLLPFTWQEVWGRGGIPATDRCILDEAREWQMRAGLCIPMRSLRGLQSLVTLSGLAPEMSEGAKGALHLMTIYTQAKEHELSNWHLKSILSPTRLTRRERECALWIAAGKSTWDIGQILGLSEQTVASYVKSAMHKLNVVTRAQLVADALRLGEIAL